jgi:glyoxylase-like metal-dependent hydrolase (beta-lactamase superfamily II)
MTITQPRRATDQAAFILAPNPGPMTLDGTNSYLLSGPDATSSIVVDPGPGDADHLAALAAAGSVELILITHRHHDHTEGAAELARLTGAPVRAADPRFCIAAEPLVDGEIIEAAGIVVTVIATPGHTDDSVCFLLAGDGPTGSVLTGDTILGRGTTVIAPPDGSIGSYLGSLKVLSALGPRFVLPAHGPQLPDLRAVAGQYLAHREQRLDQIRSALDVLGSDAAVGAVTDLVYDDIDPSVRFAAEYSVAAQLEYLRGAGTGPQPR